MHVEVTGQAQGPGHVFCLVWVSHHCIRLASWLASFQGSPVSTSHICGVTGITDGYQPPCLASRGSGALNSGPHICAASTLPAELSQRIKSCSKWQTMLRLLHQNAILKLLTGVLQGESHTQGSPSDLYSHSLCTYSHTSECWQCSWCVTWRPKQVGVCMPGRRTGGMCGCIHLTGCASV